ncbi:hypothetical protein [Burkholderia phage FLC9]|nr:hypothetical protein [Burkholderia phage FLC9]
MAISELNLTIAEIVARDADNKGSSLAKEQALIIGTHQHYKGGIYQVILECPHSETDEPMVVRKHLWPYEHSFKAVPKLVFEQEIAPGVLRYRPITQAEKDAAEQELKRKYA